MLGVEALHTREVRNTHALLANHLNYIRNISLLENATAVMSFEYALNAIEPPYSLACTPPKNMEADGEWRGVTTTLRVNEFGYISRFDPKLKTWTEPYRPSTSGKDRAKFMHNGITYFPSQLVCEAFHGPKPGPDYTVDHINRNFYDDHSSNLRWATKSEQAQNRNWTTKRNKWDETQYTLPGEEWVQLGRRRISSM